MAGRSSSRDCRTYFAGVGHGYGGARIGNHLSRPRRPQLILAKECLSAGSSFGFIHQTKMTCFVRFTWCLQGFVHLRVERALAWPCGCLRSIQYFRRSGRRRLRRLYVGSAMTSSGGAEISSGHAAPGSTLDSCRSSTPYITRLLKQAFQVLCRARTQPCCLHGIFSPFQAADLAGKRSGMVDYILYTDVMSISAVVGISWEFLLSLKLLWGEDGGRLQVLLGPRGAWRQRVISQEEAETTRYGVV